MSSDKHWVDKDTYRTVSDDGRVSKLYRDNGLFQGSTLLEKTEHHEDGTSESHDPDWWEWFDNRWDYD
jgi:hypothetical protein